MTVHDSAGDHHHVEIGEDLRPADVVNLTDRVGSTEDSHQVDQGVVDTLVNGSGMAAEGSGQVLRKSQNGKVQWYAAYLFLGATILAAIFVVVAS